MMSLIATGLFLALALLGVPIAMSMGLSAGFVIWWFDMPIAVVAQRTVNALDSTPRVALIPILLLTAIGVSAYIITRPTKAEPTR